MRDLATIVSTRPHAVDPALLARPGHSVPEQFSAEQARDAEQAGTVTAGDRNRQQQRAELRRLIEMVEAAEDATRANREDQRKWRRYRNGDQWTAAERAKLTKRRQPIVTSNYIARASNWYRGYERRSRTDPKAYPRTEHETQGADIATDVLRYIGDVNNMDDTTSDVADALFCEGVGGADVTCVERANGDIDVAIEIVPPDRLIRDPHSRKRDYADAKYLGFLVWQDKDDALDEYPDGAAVIAATLEDGRMADSTYADRPSRLWCDSKRTRIKIIQLQYQVQGTWRIATFTKGGFLEGPMDSPYLDEHGVPRRTLVVTSMNIDEDNNRFGEVKDLISPQDEINKYRSKKLHLANSRQTISDDQAIADEAEMKAAMADPEGNIKVRPNTRFEIVDNSKQMADFGEMLGIAMRDMQALGPNESLQGGGSPAQSGRLNELQQQAGQTSREPFIDTLRQWKRAVFSASWLCARQFWNDEKIIRVTDRKEQEVSRYVHLNRPVTLRERLQSMPPDQAQQVAQDAGIYSEFDPRLNEVVDTENRISELMVDIIIGDGDDTVTLQSEQFRDLVELAKSGTVPITPKAILAASSLRNKDEIRQEMESGPPPQVQQLQQQLGQAQGELEGLKRTHEIDAYKAETERLKVTLPQAAAVDPMGVAQMAAQMVLQAMRTGDIAPGPMPGQQPNPAGPAGAMPPGQPQPPQGGPQPGNGLPTDQAGAMPPGPPGVMPGNDGAPPQ